MKEINTMNLVYSQKQAADKLLPGRAPRHPGAPFPMWKKFPGKCIIDLPQVRETTMKIDDESPGNMRLSPEQAREILRTHLARLEKEIKKKIDLYKPLDLKTALARFRPWLAADEYAKLREIPPDRPIETSLDELRREYLVERAYFTLQESIDRLVKFKLNHPPDSDIKFLEMVDFITARLEQDGLKKLKQFAEKSSFKTFLYTSANRLLIDYWRKRGRTREKEKKYEPDLLEMFDGAQESPLANLIDREEEETKKNTLELIPQVIAALDYKERLAVRMKYEKDANPGEIARAIGCSRYKAERLIAATEHKIKKNIENKIQWRQT